jgi:pimeloyl-ACP methyl ester carboxylesterase
MTHQKALARTEAPSLPLAPFRNPALEAWSYWVDAWQRGVLFLDVMQQRSKQYEEHAAKLAPHVLKFGAELVMDGRKLPRPVNYVLARITPPQGVKVDDKKRPFVIVDPRAGHGPGIGGFKAESEIGVAFKAGHPCYFIGFLPEPVPGQTIEDIVAAEAAFLERVIALHPEADGKPAVVGNCQAGWAVMMVAAKRPDLFGPVIVAGSPLSYWAGVRGENPMRYTGGLLGGTWLTALMGDLGAGKFDGAWLVSNFENLNPANTYWTKQYNLYSKIDTEAPRYLEFEQWWGGHVLLNAKEMQFIADELFIGNKLATGEIVTSDGTSFDLRGIRSPIIVFCSKADNITPPSQALDWILDLYEDVDDIRAHGQTIIYAVHESIGHLGIFVSGSVAKKEHDEFASNIDLIDVLPPGLYEAVMTPKEAGGPAADLVAGNYLVRFEPRTLDDIRALGGNSLEDERQFAAVARVSEINLGLYRTFVQPWVKAWANEGFAEWMRKMHPTRLPYEMFTPANPFLKSVSSLADSARENRQPVSPDNVFWQAQEQLGNGIETSLKAYGDMRDRLLESMFHAVYGSPLLQAVAGLKGSEASPRHRPGVDAVYREFVARRKDELLRNIAQGGPREAAVRALLYVRMPEGVADERSFNLLERLRGETGTGLPLTDFKALVREQFFTLLLDERRAVDAIPAMLDANPDLAARMASTLRQLIEAVGVESKVGKARIAEMQAAFESRKKAKAPKNGSPKGDRIEAARAAPSTAPAKPHRPHSRNLS